MELKMRLTVDDVAELMRLTLTGKKMNSVTS
jgi:hypothetical protein